VSEAAVGSADLLRGWIAQGAARHPDKPYVVAADDGGVLTYGELADLTRRIGGFLRARGIGPNDRVALLANNSIEHLACYLGVMAYGATICTIHIEMNRNHLDNIFARLKPALVLYQDDLDLDDLLAGVGAPRMVLGRWDAPAAGTFYAALREFAPDTVSHPDTTPRDDAVIFFTSGTSDRPKGVVLSFREHLSNIIPTAEGFGITGEDRIYDYRSMNWASAQLLGALVPLCRGATLVLGRKFSASRFFPIIRAHRATVATGNPTVVNMLLNSAEAAHRDNLPTLRFITSSSAPLLVEEWRRFEERFAIPIAQGYGSSETGWMAAVPGEERVHGTVGRPLAYYDLAIVDAAGKRLSAGETGAVEIGCFDDNEFRYLAEDGGVKITSRGRHRTGDMGFLDADGYLHLTGREKELIIRGGVNISPLEIDSVLMQRTDVIEVATVGVPDRIYGEEVVSYVVLRPGAAVGAAEILAYCNDVMPAFKAPKQIVLRDGLPKTERGKLDRKALVALWRAERQAG